MNSNDWFSVSKNLIVLCSNFVYFIFWFSGGALSSSGWKATSSRIPADTRGGGKGLGWGKKPMSAQSIDDGTFFCFFFFISSNHFCLNYWIIR